MAKKFEEVDELILNDLDNLVSYDSFYTEDGIFLEDIYKKILSDKKILDDINEKYSKKNTSNITLIKDERFLNLNEIITKLNWAVKFRNLISNKNEKAENFIELHIAYQNLENKNLKSESMNVKVKKENTKSKKKRKDNLEIEKNKNNINNEINILSKDIKKDNDCSLFFKNEFNLLSYYISDYENWKNSFNNKLEKINSKIEDLEMKKNNINLDNQKSQVAEFPITINNIENEVNKQNDVSNNSTVKNSKKKKNNKKGECKKVTVNEQSDINQNNTNFKEENLSKNYEDEIDFETPFDINFQEKFSFEELNHIIKESHKLKINVKNEINLVEVSLEMYNNWLNDYYNEKKLDFKKAKSLLLEVENSLLASEEMIKLQNLYNEYLNLAKTIKYFIENFKDFFKEFYHDINDNSIKISNTENYEEFINNEKGKINSDMNNTLKDKNQSLDIEKDKENNKITTKYPNQINFKNLRELTDEIKALKIKYDENTIAKNSSIDLISSLINLENVLQKLSFMILKIIKEENDLNIIKYLIFVLNKHPLLFCVEIEKLSRKANLIENFDDIINGENNLLSLKSIEDLEFKLSELNVNSEKILKQVKDKKNLIFDLQNKIENFKKDYLEFEKIPDKNILFDMQNKIILNKIFLENKYSLLLNSWNKFYEWYENIIKFLIMLKIQNKKNKNLKSEINGDEITYSNNIFLEQCSIGNKCDLKSQYLKYVSNFDKIKAAENDCDYEGGITKLSIIIENDIILITLIGIPLLQFLIKEINNDSTNENNNNDYKIINEDIKFVNNTDLNNSNNLKPLVLKGNFLNLKKKLTSAIIYIKISDVLSLFNIYGINSFTDKLNKMEIDDEIIGNLENIKEEEKSKKIHSLIEIYDLYDSLDFDLTKQNDSFRDKLNLMDYFYKLLKKWFIGFFELYHYNFKINKLENFFLSKNLICKLLPLKNQASSNLSALGNMNNEFSKINFEHILEMKSFFELINLISILTDFSKSIADLINFEKKLNNGNKRKFEMIFSDYFKINNETLKKLENLNFDNLIKAFEFETFIKNKFFKDEKIEIPPENDINKEQNCINLDNIQKENDAIILFFNKIHNAKISGNSENMNCLLENILKDIHFSKEIEKEIQFFKKWMEKFSIYKTQKESKNYQLIDLCLIEILITESQISLFDLSQEVEFLKKDIEKNKETNFILQKLIIDSENFSKKLNEENEILLMNIHSDQCNLSDLNVINKFKSLYWMQRVFNFLENAKTRISSNVKGKEICHQDDTASQNYIIDTINIKRLYYKTALKLSQEATSLFNFFDIKKKDFYISFMNQITTARNIRDVIELIKATNSNNLKQPISEESFERIHTEIGLCLIDLPEETELVEKFKIEKNSLLEKYNKFITEIQTLNSYEKFLIELKNFGILMTNLITKIDKSISEAISLNREIKRIIELQKSNKNMMILYRENINFYMEKYKSLKINTEYGESLKNMFERSDKIIEKLKDMVIKDANFDLKLNLELNDDYINKNNLELPNLNVEEKNQIDIYDINIMFNKIEIHSFIEEKKIKKKLWLKKYQLIFEEAKYLPDFHFLNNLYSEISEISVIELNCEDKIRHLKNVISNAKDLINKVLNCNKKENLENLKIEAKNLKIDFNEFFIQQEVKIQCKGYDIKEQNDKAGINKKMDINNKESINLKFDSSKNLKFNSNIDSIKFGFLDKNIKKDNQNESALIEIEDNCKAEKIILNKKFLNIKGDSKPNLIPFIDLNSENEEISDENKFLGNKRKQNDIVDLITNTSNEEFFHMNDNANLSQTRSRRNINVKIDKDFYYDKEYIKNIENITGKNNSTKTVLDIDKKKTENEYIIRNDQIALNQNTKNLLDEDIDKSVNETNNSIYHDNINSKTNLFHESFLISGEVSEEDENNKKENISELDTKKEKSAYSYIYDSDKIEKRKNDVENIKRMINQGLKNPSSLKVFNKNSNPLKESIRKNSILQIQLALKENLTLYNKFGEEKLDQKAEYLEKEIKIKNPLINENYTKTLETMIKVLKELKKYTNVSSLIANEKLNLSKVAFFPHGQTLIEKFKKIEDSATKKKKKNEEKIINDDKNNEIIKKGQNNNSGDNKFSNIKSIIQQQKSCNAIIKKNINDDNNQVKRQKNDNLDFLSLMNEMNDFYSSLSASEALKGKLDILDIKDNEKNKKEQQKNDSLNKYYSNNSAFDNSLSLAHDDLHLDEDEDSLKSECELDLIKFSPTNKFEVNNSQGKIFLFNNYFQSYNIFFPLTN